jgi:hypothetical protein
MWNDTTALDNPVGRQYGKVLVILILWLGPIVSLVFLPRKKEEIEPLPLSFLTPLKTPVDEYSSTVDEENDDSSEAEAIFKEFDGEERKAIVSSWRVLHDEEECHLDEIGCDPDDLPLPPKPSHNIVVDFRADLSLPEMLQTPSAWLMLWTTLILVGSGTAKTNNMGQMVEALGFSDVVTPATLSIFAVAQSGARIITGIVSEAALKWDIHPIKDIDGIPRPYFLVIASCISLLGHLILSFTTSLPLFVVGNAVSAIAFGMAWPLMVLIVSDVFCYEHHGANYVFFDGGTKALGTLFLSTYVAGSVYEAHVDREAGDGLTCMGAHCFEDTHLVTAGLTLTCMVASLLLCNTTRHAYIR